MGRYFLAVVLYIACLSGAEFRDLSAVSKINQCIKEYIPKIENLGLDKGYLDELRVFDAINGYNASNSTTTIVLDVGLGSMWHSDVFRHMIQLNISGMDQNMKSSQNCEFESNPRNNSRGFRLNLLKNDPRYVYALGNMPSLPTFYLNWMYVLASVSNVKVLMNDVSDEEYFNNQNTVMCIPEWQRHIPGHCFVPLLHPRLGFNASTNNHLIRSFSFDKVKIMLAAYRDLIRCMVPAERLFEFNLNSMPAEEYWSKLVSFLKIDVGGGAVGVKYLSEGGSVCDSVSMRTDARHAKRVQCADEYASNIASIYGRHFKGFVREYLLKSVYAERRAPEDSDRLVLGVGPGSTGTRTIFFSTSQLEMTGLHYQSLSLRKGLKKVIKRSDFEYDMRVLQKDPKNGTVLWLDTPVVNRWWYLFKLYPRTQFIVTDVRNTTAWWEKRYGYHCKNTKIRINDPSCVAPMAIRCDREPMSYDLFRAAQLKVASVETVLKTFEAYRSLIRCIVPPEQVWWIYLTEVNSSEEYWDRLIKLAKVEVSSQRRNSLIEMGIPRCGSTGCFWNGTQYKVSY